MSLQTIDGVEYRLPGKLSRFQRALYVHLIRWKWKRVGKEPGVYRHKGRHIEYDGILPSSKRENFPHIYKPVIEALKAHRNLHGFRLHSHFYHMASSQAANVNLFLPVLRSRHAAAVFQHVKPDLKRLAKISLPDGFRIEFCDAAPGVLGDKTETAGTDADIRIEYFNHHDEPCLWLVEHKLTEKEFTACGGAKSKHRVKDQHDCVQNFSALLKNKDACYYHSAKKFNYWTLTDTHQAYFARPATECVCPFMGGLNQLWRNQLLALGVQHAPNSKYKHVSFSVVHHPGNTALKKSMDAFKGMMSLELNFSSFTSDKIVSAAEALNDPELTAWAAWYRDLYNLKTGGGAHA